LCTWFAFLAVREAEQTLIQVLMQSADDHQALNWYMNDDIIRNEVCQLVTGELLPEECLLRGSAEEGLRKVAITRTWPVSSTTEKLESQFSQSNHIGHGNERKKVISDRQMRAINTREKHRTQGTGKRPRAVARQKVEVDKGGIKTKEWQPSVISLQIESELKVCETSTWKNVCDGYISKFVCVLFCSSDRFQSAPQGNKRQRCERFEER
jgi:hypothetical protein